METFSGLKYSLFASFRLAVSGLQQVADWQSKTSGTFPHLNMSSPYAPPMHHSSN